MKAAKNGIEVLPGQVWTDQSGEMKSLIVGFSSEGFPVIETMGGWPIKGEFIGLEKYFKSAFLHEIKQEDCKHTRTVSGLCGSSHCADCLLMLT